MADKISGPSVKAMRAAFEESRYGISDAQIARLKALMDGAEKSRPVCDELKIDYKYLNRWQRILAIANKWLNCHGVEYLRSKTDNMHQSEGIEYCNTGETYDSTLMFDCRSNIFKVGCWGDIVERDSKRFGD